ncbi:hypothetical protein A3A20_02485 [Candidatus Wolfebacteria bacterium RIFCSPLOWO2_01_FULL_45_19]|uniref:Uncharacterized protein n=1 Tax=Candidatus Wolfebacteria bacterium RIFCSPLOWO2_01_FULL_45_19 TaxID=1802557 RepID=A0A1F8DSA3_9BACT|nr:MAG: hypothetical protein A3A20_02485 [Candidatus Wolfebacteria bacterium RIFCSPLOWO2_01_FULL_45_19]
MFKDPYFISGFIISAIVVAISGVLLWNFFSNWDASVVVLSWDVYSGVRIFGDTGNVLGIFGIAVFVIFLNFGLATYLYNRERFLAYLFSFASIVFSILILIAAGALVFFN